MENLNKKIFNSIDSKLHSQLSSKFHWRLYSEIKSGVKTQMEHGKFK